MNNRVINVEKRRRQSAPPTISLETTSEMKPKNDGSTPIRLPANFALKRVSKVSDITNNVSLKNISNQPDTSEVNEYQMPVVNSQKRQNFNPSGNMRIAPHMSLPGLKNVLDSRFPKFLRVIWIFAMTFCIVFTFYQISTRIHEYFRNPVVLDVRIFREPFVKLPNITICPLFQESNNDSESILDYDSVTIEHYWTLEFIPKDKIKLRFSCSDIGNSRRRKKGKGNRKCTVRVKKKSVMTVLGTCITIAFQDPMDYWGIQTYVDIIIEENDMKDTAKVNTTEVDKNMEIDDVFGYFYLYHMDEEFSLDKTLDFRYLSKGRIYENELHLKEFHIRNGRCTDSLAVTKCLNTCLNKEIVEDVPCRLPFLPVTKLPECTWENFDEVVNSIDEIIRMTNLSSCNCPRRCVEYLYSVSEKLSLENVKERSSILRLLFEHNNREEITERYSYTFSMLLGDIGGNLGLFLGWCMLSLLEVLQAFFYHIKSSFDKCRERTN